MNLFRIHIRPHGGNADMGLTFKYCLEKGILGIGWRTDSNNCTKDWDEYYREASEKYGYDSTICKYIYENVCCKDLIWTRDPFGEYYLASVISGWEYWVTDESKEKDIDIANIFCCKIQKVNIDAVPGKIIACFRASRSI